MDAKRDDNRIHTALASDGAGGLEPLRVDHATSRLLLEVTGLAGTGIVGDWPTRSPRDDNYIPIICGVTDDANEDITPLRIDRRNDLLNVDLLVE